MNTLRVRPMGNMQNIKTILSLLVVIGGVLCQNSLTLAEDTILWMNSDFPPVGIAEGKYAGQGMANLIAKTLAEHLPNFAHTYDTSNLKRMFAELEAGNHVIIAGLIKTEEREKFIHFSNVPTAILTPASVVIRNKDARFGQADSVSLMHCSTIRS